MTWWKMSSASWGSVCWRLRCGGPTARRRRRRARSDAAALSQLWPRRCCSCTEAPPRPSNRTRRQNARMGLSNLPASSGASTAPPGSISVFLRIAIGTSSGARSCFRTAAGMPQWRERRLRRSVDGLPGTGAPSAPDGTLPQGGDRATRQAQGAKKQLRCGCLAKRSFGVPLASLGALASGRRCALRFARALLSTPGLCGGTCCGCFS